jgi:hypothetical protein
MRVLAKNPARQFISMGLSEGGCPGGKQSLNYNGGGLRRFVRALPIRIAGAGDVAGEIEKIFDGECATNKRAFWCAVDPNWRIDAKCVVWITHDRQPKQASQPDTSPGRVWRAQDFAVRRSAY